MLRIRKDRSIEIDSQPVLLLELEARLQEAVRNASGRRSVHRRRAGVGIHRCCVGDRYRAWRRLESGGIADGKVGAVNAIVGNMNGKYYRENEWWVSPYNFVPEVTSTFQLPARVSIHDATLRDGEQTPGVVFSVADKVAIAEKLDEIGVDRIEAGMPAVSEQDFQAIKEISKLGLKSKIYTFARAMNADIDKALECGCHGVIIEIPIGYPKLKYQFKWTWEDVLKKSIGVVNYAKSRGMHVVYFPYDTTRAREEDLTNLLTRLMQEAPAGFRGRRRYHGLRVAGSDEVHGASGEIAHQASRGSSHAQRFRHGRGDRTGRRRSRRRSGA